MGPDRVVENHEGDRPDLLIWSVLPFKPLNIFGITVVSRKRRAWRHFVDILEQILPSDDNDHSVKSKTTKKKTPRAMFSRALSLLNKYFRLAISSAYLHFDPIDKN